MIRIPIEMQTELLTMFYIILAIIIFLWGKAIGFNETAEAFKIADKKETVVKLRLEVLQLRSQNKELVFENENLTKWKKSVKKAVEV